MSRYRCMSCYGIFFDIRKPKRHVKKAVIGCINTEVECFGTLVKLVSTFL